MANYCVIKFDGGFEASGITREYLDNCIEKAPYKISSYEWRQDHELRLKKTDAEKASARRLYRKEYMQRPIVREKQAARAKDPEVQRKKMEYAQKPEIKQRKKELTARGRIIKRELKEQHPQLYHTILKKIEKNGGVNKRSQPSEK